MELTKIKNLLMQKGIKPSLHRMKILEYIVLNKNHPTVDMIFKDISAEIPTLSKTTVYNTLKTFQDSNVVQAITIEDNELRYDAAIESHAHFKCVKCGRLYDIEFENKALNLKTINGHLIQESQLYYKGHCAYCRKKK